MSSNSLQDLMASITSYGVAALGSMVSTVQHIPWMGIGAAILLIARLIQDVPKAWAVIQEWREKRKQRKLF